MWKRLLGAIGFTNRYMIKDDQQQFGKMKVDLRYKLKRRIKPDLKKREVCLYV